MIPLEQLEALCNRAASGEGSLADALLPVETALDDIPALAVTRADAARLHRGQAVLLRGRDAPNSSGTVYVTVAGRLLALAEIGNGELIPKRVFNLTGLTASSGRNNEKSLTMSITAERKAEVIKTNANKAGDTGSPEVQVAILSERINNLTGHFKIPREGQSFAPRSFEAGRNAPFPARLHQEEGRGALQGVARKA